jgi:hypothetical protein
MQKGLSLVQLASKIEGLKTLKHDFVASTGLLTMQVQDDKKMVLEAPGSLRGETQVASYPVLETAHNQIGARLEIPAKYYDRMRAQAPDLLATNVNAWFRKNPETRMVRTLGGDVRAFLSNRYQRIENEEIASVALPILLETPDINIVSCEVTDRRMYIQAVWPRLEGEVKRGDLVQAGVVISNSEIGQGAVAVSPLLWRLVCLNGMIAADGKLRGYHVGGRVDSNEALWADDTRKADDRAILLKVRDTVRAALDQAAFGARLDKIKGLTDAHVSGNPEKVVEILAQKVGASESEKGGILRALIEGADLSAWGLLNAVTAQAHTAGTYDRAVEFEAAGGQLLDLPATEWKRVLEAA